MVFVMWLVLCGFFGGIYDGYCGGEFEGWCGEEYVVY